MIEGGRFSMWLTPIWILLWLISGAGTLALGTPVFWALLFAIVYDLFYNGYYQRGWVRRP